MKREDILQIFEGATDEQIEAMLELIAREQAEALNDDGAQEKPVEPGNASGEIDPDEPEAVAEDVHALRTELEAYRQAEAERLAAEQARSDREALLERLDAALGTRRFLHERLREAVADDFSRALHDAATQGLSDEEIFERITRDRGYFVSQNPPATRMARFGETPGSIEASLRKVMGLRAK